jgi:hypothetical protein
VIRRLGIASAGMTATRASTRRQAVLYGPSRAPGDSGAPHRESAASGPIDRSGPVSETAGTARSLRHSEQRSVSVVMLVRIRRVCVDPGKLISSFSSGSSRRWWPRLSGPMTAGLPFWRSPIGLVTVPSEPKARNSNGSPSEVHGHCFTPTRVTPTRLPFGPRAGVRPPDKVPARHGRARRSSARARRGASRCASRQAGTRAGQVVRASAWHQARVEPV